VDAARCAAANVAARALRALRAAPRTAAAKVAAMLVGGDEL